MLFSLQLYVNAGESKPRRRRKKKQGEGSGSGIMRKRKLSDEQVNLLEQSFGSEHKLESERKDKLASELGLDPRQVAVWFQNRRARWKSKKLEEEYSKLKSDHDTNVVEKCRLESEVHLSLSVYIYADIHTRLIGKHEVHLVILQPKFSRKFRRGSSFIFIVFLSLLHSIVSFLGICQRKLGA